MIKLKNLIKENSDSTYDYGCAMIYFSFPEISKIHNMIDTNDIYTEDGDNTYGLEDEPHTTLLYGLHKEVGTNDVENITDKYTYYTCKIYNPSLFENEKYDVLKFDVSGDNLKETNSDLTKLPHTTDYPNYHPHLTIGYLKSGMGKKYVEMINKSTSEFFLAPQYVIYSKPDGSKDKINIKID